eukprot:1190390-Prorocentrum_minimum.AAC.3
MIQQRWRSSANKQGRALSHRKTNLSIFRFPGEVPRGKRIMRLRLLQMAISQMRNGDFANTI